MRNSFFGILALFVILVSCEKNENKVGLELLPSSENLGLAVDSSAVLLYQVRQDSLRSDRFPSVLIGDFYDPYLDDTTHSNLYVQFRLSEPNVDFGADAVLDSLVVSLAYNDYSYGELDEIKVSVHRLSENLYRDSVYHNYDNAAFYADDIADPISQIFTPNLQADVVVGNDTLDPHMRIRIDNLSGLGDQLLDPANKDSLANNTVFLKFFKGLRISADAQSGNGELLGFNINSSLSKMTVFYHLPELDSLSFDFVISEQFSQQFMEFTHSYNEDFLNLNNDMPVTDQVYIQANAGLGFDVVLPNIYDFNAEENIIINRAVLEFPVIGDNLELYKPNEALKAIMKRNGVFVNIPDASLSSSVGGDFTGGDYDEENQVYRMTITSFVQQVLNGKIEEPRLTIIPSFSRTVGNRAIIKVGGINEDRRTKLIINYTTY